MGYGLIHVKGNKMEMITMGVLHLSKLNSHADKLKRIFERTLALIDEYKALSSRSDFFADPEQIKTIGSFQDLYNRIIGLKNNDGSVLENIGKSLLVIGK